VDQAFGAQEILSSRHLAGTSQLVYYGENSNIVKAVRYRADLYRDKNPLISPIIDNIRIKFRHNEEG